MVKKEFKVNTVIHKPNLIYISWENIDGMYRVYRNNCLVYEGISSEFNDRNIEQGKTYSYSIERIIGNQVIDVIAVQTSAFRERTKLTNPLHSITMTTIVTKNHIVLSWEKIEGVENYDIYCNGKYIETTPKSQYVNYDFSLSEPHTYKVIAKRFLWMKGERTNSYKNIGGNFFRKLNRKIKGEPNIEQFSMTKVIAQSQKLLTPVSERKKNREMDRWKLRYTTFLEETFIQNPNGLSRHKFFLGDERGFDLHGKSYRTRVDLDLAYNKPGMPFTCKKNVGKTVSFNRLKEVYQIKTASMDGINFSRMHSEKDQTSFLLTHSVGNPLISAPAIDYEVQGVFRRDGTYELTGYHDQAPHHEIYLQRGEKTPWFSIHLAESKGLAWLTPIIACNYWRFSNFG